MTKTERKLAVSKLNKICKTIGCSCTSERQYNNPHRCDIIKKLLEGDDNENRNRI